MEENLVVLVDEYNNEIWTMEKLAAHENGWHLHRAFSIFLFNKNNELLVQQRDSWKYHCGWLWSNTVCSHQKPGETNLDAAVRRSQEELWISLEKESLQEVGSEIYRAEFDNGLTEHEYDFVIVWEYNDTVSMNPEEVMDHKWVSIEQLKEDMEKSPNNYTPWFKIIISKWNFSDFII